MITDATLIRMSEPARNAFQALQRLYQIIQQEHNGNAPPPAAIFAKPIADAIESSVSERFGIIMALRDGGFDWLNQAKSFGKHEVFVPARINHLGEILKPLYDVGLHFSCKLLLPC
jgi:hypothetical protein